MGILGPTTPIWQRHKRVRFQNPGPLVSNGDAGWQVGSWIDIGPPADYSMEPATASSLERISASTLVANATHVLRGPYRAGVSTLSRVLLDDGRTLAITSWVDPEERHVELILVCTEILGVVA